MPCDVCLSRARTGAFYAVACTLGRSLMFLNLSNAVVFFILINPNLKHQILIALFVHMLCVFQPIHKRIVKTCQLGPGSFIFDGMGCYSPYVVKVMLLTRSGDVHPNPGPPNVSSDLCVTHINAWSIRDKIDTIQAEADKFDVITVSETWLTEDDKENVYLAGFHPPIRRDRPTGPYGGVAIYVRDNLICKERPDLDIPGLEAIWIETKLNQTRLLIGSFYRPPSALVSYWDLVEASLRKADSTGLMFVVLGDFNEDWLSSPSQHLVNIVNMFNMRQLVQEPNRITDRSRTCIDLVLT